MSCGHCAAVCPSGAVQGSVAPDHIQPARPQLRPSPEQLEELLRSRRSVRRFADRPVARELLQRVAQMAATAPSAHNNRSTALTVVQDRGLLAEVARFTAESMARVVRLASSRLTRPLMKAVLRRRMSWIDEMLPAMRVVLARWASGHDAILYRAPAAVVFHGEPRFVLADVNAQLALQNAALAVEALGLGSFYCGFVLAMAERDRRIGQALKLPPRHRILGMLAVGHPTVPFERNVVRPPSISWL